MMENKFIKSKIQFGTREIWKWECLTPTVFYKEEIRKKMAEKEIVASYLNAAESIYCRFEQLNNPEKEMIKVFSNNQMCMPFLYMCRHTVELAIKYRLKQIGVKYDKIHRLDKLWSVLKENEKNTNEDFDLLIETLNIIDDDGCKLRYAVDKNDNEYNNEPIFVKADMILDTTKKIYKCLTKQKEE